MKECECDLSLSCLFEFSAACKGLVATKTRFGSSKTQSLSKSVARHKWGGRMIDTDATAMKKSQLKWMLFVALAVSETFLLIVPPDQISPKTKAGGSILYQTTHLPHRP